MSCLSSGAFLNKILKSTHCILHPHQHNQQSKPHQNHMGARHAHGFMSRDRLLTDYVICGHHVLLVEHEVERSVIFKTWIKE